MERRLRLLDDADVVTILDKIVVKEALNNLGVPVLKEFNGEEGFFEGCLLLSKETIFVADTERHSYPFIREFISDILNDFNEVIYTRIPKARRYMHPDTVFNRISGTCPCLSSCF